MFRGLIIKLTYLLTPWCRLLFEKLIVTQLVKKFPAFYGTRRFIIVFREARHWIVSWASWIHFAPSTCLPEVHLNVILPPTPRSSQWSLTSGPHNQNPINTSPLPHACHMSCPPHPPSFNHPNNIRRRIQAVKFITMQFSPWSIFLPFRSKYPPQHCVLKKPSVCVPPSKWETKFRTHTAQMAKLQFCIF
jgi:hypothetical protein